MSKFAKEVNILIRRDAIKNTAANYLAENISKTPNIKVLPYTEVISATGEKVLEKITLKNSKTGEENTVPAKALFIYIGTKPGTAWLNDIVLKDEKGFIITGSELMKDKSFHTFWKLEREPFMPETSVPGIFASGDVRFTALTGISSAVGEGAMAIRFVRKYLSEVNYIKIFQILLKYNIIPPWPHKIDETIPKSILIGQNNLFFYLRIFNYS